jgi:hypothetical protein
MGWYYFYVDGDFRADQGSLDEEFFYQQLLHGLVLECFEYRN